MRVVISGEYSERVKLFAGLAAHLRDAKCATDRDGTWSPHQKAEKAAVKWALAHGHNHELKPTDTKGINALHINV